MSNSRIYRIAPMFVDGQPLGRYRVIQEIRRPEEEGKDLFTGRGLCECIAGHESPDAAALCEYAQETAKQELEFEQYDTLARTGELIVTVN